MHPTLPVGSYDWDPRRLPKEEFTDRIQAFWEAIPDASAAVVYGDSRNHAELIYLSNFVPKLGPAFLLLPRHGEPLLLASGAPNMLPAARRMTWIERTQPLRDAGKQVVQWMGESGSLKDHQIALVGGEYLRAAVCRSLNEALPPKSPRADATALLQKLMRCKRPRELRLIGTSCSILNVAAKALAQAKHSGAGATDAILEAERVAHHAGAQDVRTLFSIDGGRTLRPFEAPIARAVDPLQAYVAVRYAGYWAEGFIAVANSEHAALKKAADGLKSIVNGARAGARCRDLLRLAAEGIAPYDAHAITKGNMGAGIGLSLSEEPQLLAASEDVLGADCVYTLRVGASDGRQHHAIVSAMIAVHRDRSEVLWSTV